MFEFIKKQSPVRVIALGFALVILLGSVLLIMPFSVQEGVDVAYIDTLYTSTSAVCVTGLIATDAGDTFTFVGQLILQPSSRWAAWASPRWARASSWPWAARST